MSTKIVVTTESDTKVITTTDPLPFTVVTAGAQGPAGRDGKDGKSGAKVSAAPGNQIEEKDDGLYAPPPTWSIKEW